MHSSINQRANAVMLAVGLLVSGAAADASAQTSKVPGLSASAALSNLQFNLVNLASDSGIAPWITFDLGGAPGVSNPPATGLASVSGLSTWRADGNLVGSNGDGASFEGPLPSSASSVVAKDGTGVAAVSASAYEATVSLSANQLPVAANTPNVLAGLASSQVSFGGGASPEMLISPSSLLGGGAVSIEPWLPVSLIFPVNFILSPHTKLVLQGQAELSAQLTGPNGLNAFYDPDPGLLGASTDVRARLALQRTTPLQPLQATYDSMDAFYVDYASQYATAVDGISNSVLMGPNAQPWRQGLQVTLSNDSDQALEGIMSIEVGATISMSRRSSVPEPGGWVLMGLGLVGMISLARRRAV